MLDLIHGAPDINRNAASRKRQREAKKQEQHELLEAAKLRSKILKKGRQQQAKLERTFKKVQHTEYRTAMVAKMSSDGDVATELLQRRSRILSLKE